MTHQHGDGVFELRPHDAQVRILRLRRFQLSLGLRHRFIGIDSGVVQGFGQVERFLKRNNRGIEQLFQIVLPAQLEIIHGHFGVSGEPDIFQVCFAGLCGRGLRPHRIAHPAPQIRHPGGVKRKIEERRGSRAGRRRRQTRKPPVGGSS